MQLDGSADLASGSDGLVVLAFKVWIIGQRHPDRLALGQGCNLYPPPDSARPGSFLATGSPGDWRVQYQRANPVQVRVPMECLGVFDHVPQQFQVICVY